MKPLNSVKLIPHDSVDLDRLSYSNGDLVFDVTLGTIRLMDGSTLGGSKIATQGWVSLNYTTSVGLTSTLANYVTSSSLTTTLAGYVTTTTLTNANYITLANLNVGTANSPSGTGAISYTNSTGVFVYTPPDLSSYATTASLSSYVTSSGLTTALSSYANNTNLALKAPLASPQLTGTLTVPTAIIGGVNIKAFALAVAAAMA
jgi:hypothetical protein